MIKFYYDLGSQPCRSLYVFLRRNKIPFEKKVTSILNGETATTEFRNLSPFAILPVIEDNGYKLFESIAIFRYLMNTNKNIPRYWYPVDPVEQAEVEKYLNWHHTNTRIMCSGYVQTKLIIPIVTQKLPDEDKLKRVEQRMVKVLNSLENYWCKNNSYITGKHLTFADLFAFCEVQQPLSLCGYDIFKERPNLQQWYSKVEDELQPEIGEASADLEKSKKAAEAFIPKL